MVFSRLVVAEQQRKFAYERSEYLRRRRIPCHLDHRIKKREASPLFFDLIVGTQIQVGLRSKRKFAYPARRSTSSLVRRRAWVSRSEAVLPCHLDQKSNEGFLLSLLFCLLYSKAIRPISFSHSKEKSYKLLIIRNEFVPVYHIRYLVEVCPLNRFYLLILQFEF